MLFFALLRFALLAGPRTGVSPRCDHAPASCSPSFLTHLQWNENEQTYKYSEPSEWIKTYRLPPGKTPGAPYNFATDRTAARETIARLVEGATSQASFVSLLKSSRGRAIAIRATTLHPTNSLSPL